MSGQFFEGAAGTGKTYNLITSLEQLVLSRTLEKHQKVLALTYMHGSRTRLDSALSELIGLRKRFDCMTFDALAGQIVNRWRDLLHIVKQRKEIPIGDTEYEKICFEAAELLENVTVQQWVFNTHPIVVVDEAQDLSEARLAMMQGLVTKCILLAAADEYQHLDQIHGENIAIQWLCANFKKTTLTQPRRTNDHGLLTVANALREEQSIMALLHKKGKKLKYFSLEEFKIVPVAKPALMSWNASFEINQAWHMGETAILILSDSDNITQQVLGRIRERKESTKLQSFGPYPSLRLERKVKVISAECFDSLCIEGQTVLSTTELLGKLENIEDPYIKQNLRSRIKRRQRISGIQSYEIGDIQSEILTLYQNRKRYSYGSMPKLQAMTIYQAKNREFENVIVLWTFSYDSLSASYRRRILYNAITRAKRRCVVLVMGGENRLSDAPFS